jgi:hypothetical protein
MKLLQSPGLIIAMVSVALMTGLVTRAEVRSPSESSLSRIVTGEVSTVEGQFHMAKDAEGKDTLDIVDKFYVITNQRGEEMRLELSERTKVETRVNPGDKIEARISPEGRTLSVTRLQ